MRISKEYFVLRLCPLMTKVERKSAYIRLGIVNVSRFEVPFISMSLKYVR